MIMFLLCKTKWAKETINLSLKLCKIKWAWAYLRNNCSKLLDIPLGMAWQPTS